MDQNSDVEVEPPKKKKRTRAADIELQNLYRFYGDAVMHPDQVEFSHFPAQAWSMFDF